MALRVPAEHTMSDDLTLPVSVSDGPPEITSKYDICIVIPLHLNRSTYKYELVDKDVHEMMERVIQAVGRNFVYMYDSYYGSLRFVLIHGNNTRLRGKAESMRTPMLLDKEKAEKVARQGDAANNIHPIQIVHRPEVTHIEPFEHIYGRYVMDKEIEKLYVRADVDDVFSRSVRIQLLMSIISDKASLGGANVNLEEYMHEGMITGYYPLHASKEDREKLGQRILSNLRPWNFPLADIRNYFGEKVAMYISYVTHYATWAILPALLGIGCQIALIWDDKAYSSNGFGLFVSIWVVCVYEFWKRKERYLAMEWGTIGEDDAAIIRDKERASFHGTEIQSYIDGSSIQYFEPKSKWYRSMFTGFVISILVLVALSSVGAIYLARALIFESYAGDVSQAGASIVNALVIIFLNFIAKHSARWLCELENHRTNASFEESFITKLFIFSFINCYTSYYYLAFGAANVTSTLGVQGEEEATYDADYNTAINIAAIFLVRYIILGLSKSSVPWIMHWMVKFWRSKKKCKSTFACIKWFFLRAAKKFIYRYVCCRIDLAYDDDTYDEYTFADTATDKVTEARKLKENRKKEKNSSSPSKIDRDEITDIDDIETEIRKKFNSFSAAEKEYRMSAYDVDGIATRYLEQIIIFGYMTFFVSALPSAFALGLLAMLSEVRGEIWMMLHRYQRPVPQRIEGIGLWKSIMELMIVIAVCTNAGVVIFTMKTFDSFTDFQRLGIFVLFQYGVFLIQYVIGALIPDNPIEVTIQRQRQEFITSKLIEKEHDLDVDPLAIL